MFPLTRVPFWYQSFEPRPFGVGVSRTPGSGLVGGGVNWVWVKIKPPGYGPQVEVVVEVSIYQGSILGTYF